MRSESQIAAIKSRLEDPYSVKNFLLQDEVSHLIDIFETNEKSLNSPAVYKNTGPVTLDLKLFLDDLIVKQILDRLKIIIGTFDITAAFFFATNFPHIIHNDDTFELPDNVYKGITIPLKINGQGVPKLCFFNQHYFHGPAKFFNGSENIPTFYNQQIYDYKNVDGLVEENLIDDNKYFTHLKHSWLKGLSLHSAIDWIPTSAIIFDSVRLHCASDFRNLGITSKLGISIFTKK